MGTALASSSRASRLLVAQSKAKLALASFDQGLGIARQQHARAWEQRILASQAAVS